MWIILLIQAIVHFCTSMVVSKQQKKLWILSVANWSLLFMFTFKIYFIGVAKDRSMWNSHCGRKEKPLHMGFDLLLLNFRASFEVAQLNPENKP